MLTTASVPIPTKVCVYCPPARTAFDVALTNAWAPAEIVSGLVPTLTVIVVEVTEVISRVVFAAGSVDLGYV